MFYVIEDDKLMAECIERAIVAVRPDKKVFKFTNAIAAMAALDEIPEMIFLDVLLDGPDGFTFLNELASYSDTRKIPIVIISTLALKLEDLKSYGVVEVIDKTTMRPEDIGRVINERC